MPKKAKVLIIMAIGFAAIICGFISNYRSSEKAFATELQSSMKTQNAGAVSGTGTLKAKDYVLEILNTRRTNPERTPVEWERFWSNLKIWNQGNRADCNVTLRSNRWDWVLREVEDFKMEFTDDELYRIAAESTSSTLQMECYKKLWDKKSEQGPDNCVAFVNAIPTLLRPVFEEYLSKLWIDRNGAKALDEIVVNKETPSSLFDNVLRKLTESHPQEVLQFIQKTDADVFKQKFGSPAEKESRLFAVCQVIPPAQVIEVLAHVTPSMLRDSHMQAPLYQATQESPQLAEKLIAENPSKVSTIANAAVGVARKKPRDAATILNAVPGEVLRTRSARNIIMDLPEKEGLQFIEAISDSLTRESVRKTYLLIHQPKKEAPQK